MQLERQVRALASMFDGVQLVVAPELHLMALPPLLERTRGRPRSEQCLSPGRSPNGSARSPARRASGSSRAASTSRPDEGVVQHRARLLAGGRARHELPQVLSLAAVRDDAARARGGRLRDRRHRPRRARDLPRRRVPGGLPPAGVGRRRGDRPGEPDRRRATARPRSSSRARTRIVNQVSVVNVNAAAPVGNGRSVVVDPEGTVLYEAGAARRS